jgi:hypothetical protein
VGEPPIYVGFGSIALQTAQSTPSPEPHGHAL